MSDRGRGSSSRGGGNNQQRGGGGGRGGGGSRGGRGGGGGGASTAPQQKEERKKEVILDLAKFVDKKIRVKFQGGREGESFTKECSTLLQVYVLFVLYSSYHTTCCNLPIVLSYYMVSF